MSLDLKKILGCPYCGKRYKMLQHLNLHITKKHQDNEHISQLEVLIASGVKRPMALLAI